MSAGVRSEKSGEHTIEDVKSKRAAEDENAEASRDDVRIRVAQVDDAKKINDLANSVALSKLEKEGIDISRTGFLVSGYGTATYEDFIQRVDHFYVLESLGEMKSFMLAYSSEHIISEKEELNAHIRDNVCAEFVLIKQICTHPDCMGKGFAQALYSHLYKTILASETPLPIYTVIVEKPLNPRSISFHHKAGFAQEFTYTPPDGMQRLVFSNKELKTALAGMRSEESPMKKTKT